MYVGCNMFCIADQLCICVILSHSVHLFKREREGCSVLYGGTFQHVACGTVFGVGSVKCVHEVQSFSLDWISGRLSALLLQHKHSLSECHNSEWPIKPNRSRKGYMNKPFKTQYNVLSGFHVNSYPPLYEAYLSSYTVSVPSHTSSTDGQFRTNSLVESLCWMIRIMWWLFFPMY